MIKKEEEIKLYSFIERYNKLYIDIENVTKELETINKKKDILLEKLVNSRKEEINFTNYLKEKYNINDNDIKNIIS